MKLYIKNMVCNRCTMVVKKEFEKLGYPPVNVKLGEVEIKEELSQKDLTAINLRMKDYGFELIDDVKSRAIEKIKNVIVWLVHHSEEELKVNYSQYIESQLNRVC